MPPTARSDVLPGLVIEPVNHHVTHVLLQEGHFWGRKEVVIPIGAVIAIEEGDLRLSLTKQEVEDLPAVDVHDPTGTAPTLTSARRQQDQAAVVAAEAEGVRQDRRRLPGERLAVHHPQRDLRIGLLVTGRGRNEASGGSSRLTPRLRWHPPRPTRAPSRPWSR